MRIKRLAELICLALLLLLPSVSSAQQFTPVQRNRLLTIIGQWIANGEVLGGAGSGDLTEVQGTPNEIEVTSGTGPVPVISLPATITIPTGKTLGTSGTGTITANRTGCTGINYLKADGTCAAPNSAAPLTLVGSSDVPQLDITANATQSNTSPLIIFRKADASTLFSMHSDSNCNIFIGQDAGAANTAGAVCGSTDGTALQYIGYQAGQSNTTGKYNVGFGDHTLNANTTGSFLVALGSNALISNVDGLYSIGIGEGALFSAVSAHQNVGIGRRTGQYVTGGYNTMVGGSVMSGGAGAAEYNSVFGYNAMVANTTGSRNAVFGMTGMAGNTTGTGSLALGFYAGFGDVADVANEHSTVDTYMGFLGYQASRHSSIPTATVLTNGWAIGKNARISISNAIALGGTGADAVKVGIGTHAPAVELDVAGTINATTGITTAGQYTSTVATGTAPLVVASTTNIPNLNASSLNGATMAAPGAIGGTTPAAGTFTTLAADSQTLGGATNGCTAGTAGCLEWTQGTAQSASLGANTIREYAPTAVTAHKVEKVGVAATGFYKATSDGGSPPIVTQSIVALPYIRDFDLVGVDPATGVASHILNKDPLSTACTPLAIVGTNRTTGVCTFPDSDGDYGVGISLQLPETLVSADADIWWKTTGTGNARFQIATKCYADDAADDAAFNTASVVTAAAGTSGRPNKQAITAIDITGCSAGQLMRVRFFRNRTEGSDTLNAALDVEKVVLKIWR